MKGLMAIAALVLVLIMITVVAGATVPFGNYAGAVTGPATNAFDITPGAADLSIVPRALWVGTPGDLEVVTLGGDAVTLSNASGLVPIRVTKVTAGTTAAGIVGLW